MAQTAAFLNKYDTVIFDMDGVITSEQNYWTCAALTVWEWIYSNKLYGSRELDADELSKNAAKIRYEVFCDDKLIELLKAKGVNSNWDLGYIVFAVSRILETDDFSRIMDFCSNMADNILDEYDRISAELAKKLGCDCDRNGKLWTEMMHTFQEWFLGDSLFIKKFKNTPKLSKKPGLIHTEKPIIPQDRLVQIFKSLAAQNKRLATGTGRPSDELFVPLESFGIMKYFAKDGIVNYDHVMHAEAQTGMNLTKPHPYIFYKAMLGEGFPDNRIISGDFDQKMTESTLVVGDAGADILAAKAMGADFCAVLTGVSGKAARDYFEAMRAEYILDSLVDFVVE